jgi:hypothetical protein
MNLKKIVAEAGIVGALSMGALGLGAGFAHADQWQPWPGPSIEDRISGPSIGDRNSGPAIRDRISGPPTGTTTGVAVG